jgi:tetratricopeptide (TPR) repeat protein
MPLNALIDSYSKRVSRFLNGESPGPLYLRVAPETELLAAKLIAALQAEPTNDALFFAHSAQFNDAATYYAAAVDGVLANLAEHRAELAKHGSPLLGLAQLGRLEFEDSGISPELAFAEFAERMGRELGTVCARVVFVLHVEHDSDVDAFLGSSERLASGTALGRIKYIVMTAPDALLVSQLEAPQRFNVLRVKAVLSDAALSLRAFAASPERRVLLVQAPFDAIRDRDTLRDALGVAALVCVAPLVAAGASLAAAIMAGLTTQLEMHRSPLVARSDLSGAAQFAELCERLLRARLSQHAVLCVVIDFHRSGPHQGSELAAFVLELVRAAASPRVRYLVIDTSEAPCLPALTEAPRRLEECAVRLDASAIEAGLRARLADSSLPVQQRLQYLGACASLAATRQEHEVALSLHAEQLALCEQTQAPADALISWLGIGDTLVAAQRWSEAEAAYSNALALGLEHEAGVQTAQALSRLGQTALRAKNYAAAISYYQTALDWYEQLGDVLWNLHARTWLGETQRRNGEPDEARRTWLAARERCGQFDDSLREATAQAAAELTERLARLADASNDARAASAERERLHACGCQAVFVAEQP